MKTHIKSITHLVIVLSVTSLLIILSFSSFATSESKLLKVTVEFVNAADEAHRYTQKGFDVLHGSIRANSFDLVLSKDELSELRKQNVTILSVTTGQPLRDIMPMRDANRDLPSGYSDLDGIYQQMNDVASDFPLIVQLVNVTQTYSQPTTFEGRDLFALKISDNVSTDEDEPAILIVSNHHAREIVTPVIALNAIEQLTNGYGLVDEITEAVDSHEIWIVPVWNPDGYNEVVVGDNLWRKNRRVFPTGIGVDLNRNYPQGWDASCSGSTLVPSQTYKGPEPASEAETQTMMAWSMDQRFAKIIDFHSSGREVLYSYSCSFHPLESYFFDEATALSQASGYLGDTRLAGAEGEHYQWQLARFGSWSHLVETALTFQPSFALAQTEADTVWPGILHAIARPIPLTGTITDAWTGAPISADINLVNVIYTEGETNQSDGAYGRYYVFAPPGFYQIEVSARGYVPQLLDVVIPMDGSANFDILLDTFIDDKDGDGVNFTVDNCTDVSNPLQIDTDGDGYGNACDSDFNNDCIINFLDYAVLSQGFLGSDPNLDANGDGTINFLDVFSLTVRFLSQPGPSAFDDLCS